MNPYFAQFPVITYGTDTLINIAARVAILDSIKANQYAFYDYTVKNGMPAWQIAEKYYGDADLVWLVYLSNNIIDPYGQWPKSDELFNDYIVDTYGSLEYAQSTIIYYRVNWYTDDTILSIDDYNSLDPVLKKYWTPQVDNNGYAYSYVRKQSDYKTSATDVNGTQMGLPITGVEAAYWEAVSYYDMEQEANADRANIRLLDSSISSTAIANLKSLLSS